MKYQVTFWFALFLWALTATLLACTILLDIKNGGINNPETVWYALVFQVFAIVGALISAKRPGNPIGWIFCVAALANTLWAFAVEYATYAVIVNPGALPGGSWIAWAATSWPGNIGWSLMIIFVPLFFPNGRLLSRRWQPVVWFAGTFAAISVGLSMLRPGPVMDEGPLAGVQNPFGLERAAGWLEPTLATFESLLIAFMLLAITSLVLRLRRSTGEERLQLRWFVYAVSLLPVLFCVGLLTDWLGVPNPHALIIPLSAFTIIAIPSAVGIAVLKYRLYNIDLLINRTFVYGLLSGALALLYIGSVIGLQALLRVLTGQESEAAIVISTLTIAALFNPLRRLIQAFIDRRFFRRKYDAQKTLAAFSITLRNEVELERLTDELAIVIEEAMSPAHVSIWLRPLAGKG